MPLEGEQLGFLENVINIIKKYGIWETLKAIFIIGLFVWVMYNAHNVGSIVKDVVQTEFKAHAEQVEQEHSDALDIRKKIKPEVDDILKSTLNALGADRVFVMEMHNGSNNTSGLPFIYGEMTYEQVTNGIEHIDDDYININLSRFSFPLFMEREHVWCGDIKELSKVDDKLAKRMESNNVTYFAIMHIYGVSNLIGYFGVTYCNGRKPKGMKEIITQLTMTTQQLAIMLDAKNINNN